MKTFGIILLVFAGLNLIVGFIALSAGAEAAGSKFGAAFLLGGLGAYLVYRASQKKKEEEEKQNWDK